MAQLLFLTSVALLMTLVRIMGRELETGKPLAAVNLFPKKVTPQAAPACSVGVTLSCTYSSKNIPAATAVRLIKQLGASTIRLYSPQFDVFRAVAGTGMKLIVGVYPPNSSIAFGDDNTGARAAKGWVKNYIVPWAKNVTFSAITVGDWQLSSGNWYASSVVPAMQNVLNALKAFNLDSRIKVKTQQATSDILYSKDAYWDQTEPSSAEFGMSDPMNQLLKFLQATESSLFIEPQTFDHAGWTNQNYALFKGQYGFYDHGKYYQNLLHAELDSVLWAAQKAGYPNVKIEVADLGWPSAGENKPSWSAYSIQSSLPMAQQWLKSALSSLCSGNGTPKRPGHVIPVNIKEAFDEDKSSSVSADPVNFFGLHTVNLAPKYKGLSLKGPFTNPKFVPKPMWCVLRGKPNLGLSYAVEDFLCRQVGGNYNCRTSWPGVDFYNGCTPAQGAAALLNSYYQFNGQGPRFCKVTGVPTMLTTTQPAGATRYCPLPGRPHPSF